MRFFPQGKNTKVLGGQGDLRVTAHGKATSFLFHMTHEEAGESWSCDGRSVQESLAGPSPLSPTRPKPIPTHLRRWLGGSFMSFCILKW